MEHQFMLYLANLFNDRRDTHFKYSVDIGGRIYYGSNRHTFKMNQRKERRLSRKRR